MGSIRAGMVLLAAACLSACASMGGKLLPPHLTLVGAGTTSADMFSQQFRVRVHVENPYATALPIKSIDYKLFLEGDSFAEGESAAPFVVPANGQKEFDLTVHTNFASSVARLLSRLTGTDRKSIEYAFAGHLVIDKTFSPKLGFSETGTVDLGRR
jgi:LEA14-like dessication related protein